MLDVSRLREIKIQNTVTTVSKFREHPTLLSFLPCYFSLIRLYVLFSSTEFVKAVGTERDGVSPLHFQSLSLSLCASGKERKERPYNNKRFWFNSRDSYSSCWWRGSPWTEVHAATCGPTRAVERITAPTLFEGRSLLGSTHSWRWSSLAWSRKRRRLSLCACSVNSGLLGAINMHAMLRNKHACTVQRIA